MDSLTIQENYGIEIEDPRLIERVCATELPEKQIQGCPWYNILANPVYSDLFFYYGANIADRDALIIDDDSDDENNSEQSDLVIILLNLGAIPDPIV